MNKRIVMALGATIGGAALAMALHWQSHVADAADHTDSPAASLNSKADITDFYAWMVDDASNIALIVNVSRNAPTTETFPTNTYYTFNLERGGTETQVVCKFESADNKSIDCWVGTAASNVYVTGDPSSASAPLVSNGISVFAGVRDDPFFFNGAGFVATTSAVQNLCVVQNGCGGVLDANGCPDLSVDVNTGDDFPSLAGALVNCLTTQCDKGVGDNTNAAAVDNFANQNVLSLAIRVPTSLIAGTGPIAVYASTHAVN